MKNKNVYYIYIKPYSHNLTKYQIWERFINVFGEGILPLHDTEKYSSSKLFSEKSFKSKLLKHIDFFFENTK